jgi:hypothetical protein
MERSVTHLLVRLPLRKIITARSSQGRLRKSSVRHSDRKSLAAFALLVRARAACDARARDALLASAAMRSITEGGICSLRSTPVARFGTALSGLPWVSGPPEPSTCNSVPCPAQGAACPKPGARRIRAAKRAHRAVLLRLMRSSLPFLIGPRFSPRCCD